MIEFQEIPSYLPHVRFSRDFSFSRHTTVGIGGTAPVALYPKNEKELTDTVNFLLERQIPHFFLGQGANVLVSDEGFQGAVVCTIGMKKISRMPRLCGVRRDRRTVGAFHRGKRADGRGVFGRDPRKRGRARVYERRRRQYLRAVGHRNRSRRPRRHIAGYSRRRMRVFL